MSAPDLDLDVSLDRSDMLGWLADYPRQFREFYPAGREAGRRLARGGAPAFTGVLVLGTGGGSAAAAYVVDSLTRERLRVPFVVCQGYQAPAHAAPPAEAGTASGAGTPSGAGTASAARTPSGAGRPPAANAPPVRTLIVAVSHSGRTEETLSAFRSVLHERECAAGAAGGGLAVITGGGALAEEARRLPLPLVTLPTGMQARAVFPGIVAALLGLLDGAGLTTREFGGEIEEAASLSAELAAAWGPGATAGGGERRETAAARGAGAGGGAGGEEVRTEPTPLELARQTADRLLLVYGGAGATGGVARRWKNQLAENGKTLAHWYTVPEAHHDEVVGLDAPAPIREHLHACLLRDAEAESPKMKRRLDVTRDLLADRVAGVTDVSARGATPLSRALSLCLYGDYLSCYVALLRGVDPTPVPIIVELKKVMARD